MNAPALRRVAVLSDIHGVLPALEAVLAEPELAAAERIVLTGDVTAGPQPAEVLALLRKQGERVLWISGNADRELVEYRRGERTRIPDPIGPYAADQLADEDVEFLASLPLTRTLAVEGLGDVLFCHATPRDDEEVVLVDSRPDRWTEVLADLPESVRTVVCGHTHMPYVRLAHGRLIVNPGSVGMPYGRPGAHWCLLGPGTDLRVTPYDVPGAVARLVTECGYPGIAEWADCYLGARVTDGEALEAFGPRDGRQVGQAGHTCQVGQTGPVRP
ncbi:metallophosphoesterase family protein [Streptomyces sp. SID13726]|uniref:metallophosphoesterase family protein n=1 Tax=Streptomyces sp. SID13726 TaxID=2706058 RepID=UPI0013B9AFDA|nr:metallophosphoesterase family protein [Streptomyces sp. SID13726]NEB04975.1 metallophosphoesterase family protein [Streptomyces sp. SID13726]